MVKLKCCGPEDYCVRVWNGEEPSKNDEDYLVSRVASIMTGIFFILAIVFCALALYPGNAPLNADDTDTYTVLSATFLCLTPLPAAIRLCTCFDTNKKILDHPPRGKKKKTR